MIKTLFHRRILLVLLQLNFIYSSAQNKIDFKINLEKGACFELQQTEFSASNVVVNGEDKESSTEKVVNIRYWVEKRKDEYYSLGLMYTDYIVGMKGYMDKRHNAREADDLNVLNVSTMVSMVLDKPLYAKITPKGVVLSAKESKNVKKELLKRTKGLSKELKETVSNTVNAFSNKKAITGKVEIWSSYIPKKPVSLGETWTVGNDSTTLINYTFVEETDNVYIIKGIGVGRRNETVNFGEATATYIGETELKIFIEIYKDSFLPKVIIRESVGSFKAYWGEFEDEYKQFSSNSFDAKNTIEIKLCKKTE